MKISKIKEKYLKAVSGPFMRTIKIENDMVHIQMEEKIRPCLWCGIVCGKYYCIQKDKKMFTNLTEEELVNLRIYLNSEEKLLICAGNEKHLFREIEDVEADDKILVFYAMRTHAEYFAVDATLGKTIMHRFVDQRAYEQTLVLQKMLLQAYLPALREELFDSSSADKPEVEQQEGASGHGRM